MVIKVAPQAGLWYNTRVKYSDALAVLETPRAVHLVRRCTMNTVPHSASGDNPHMILIPLTRQPLYAAVSFADADLSALVWRAQNNGTGQYYARRTERYISGYPKKQHDVSMHRLILERKLGRPIKPDMVVDHINGDTLDNRRENLREATLCQNQQNKRVQSQVSHGYKGVVCLTDAPSCKQRNLKTPWVARIRAHGKRYEFSGFATAKEAARAYDRAAMRFHGEFARLNFPREDYEAQPSLWVELNGGWNE